VPRFRSDLTAIPAYRPGRPIEEVAHELGLDDIVKLASNECPVPPFPEIEHAIVRAAGEAHRYPESTAVHVRNALALHYALAPENFLVGAGSSQLLSLTTLAAGGPGTTAVFADPSFVMYRIACLVSHTRPVAIPVDVGHCHDVAAMREAITEDTRIVFLCNPNNPTGTHLSAGAVADFIDDVPDDVLIVVDEAYAEYVTAPDYATAIPEAVERDNVVVSRTFSKIYGLSGLRVGYFIGVPSTLEALRRVQPPFSVTSVAQAAAVEALRHQHRVTERAEMNAAGRDWVSDQLKQRGVMPIPSEANFVAVIPGDAATVEREMLARGVIVRRLGPLIRITVGTEPENTRLIEAWDDIVVD
jgi:histidinol-phosphate aminotransferase